MPRRGQSHVRERNFKKKERKIREKNRAARYPKKGTEIIDGIGQQVYMKQVVMDLHWCMVTVSSMGRANCTGRVNCRREGRGTWTRRGRRTKGTWTRRGGCTGRG